MAVALAAVTGLERRGEPSNQALAGAGLLVVAAAYRFYGIYTSPDRAPRAEPVPCFPAAPGGARGSKEMAPRGVSGVTPSRA